MVNFLVLYGFAHGSDPVHSDHSLDFPIVVLRFTMSYFLNSFNTGCFPPLCFFNAMLCITLSIQNLTIHFTFNDYMMSVNVFYL